ncbi:DUF1428 domain-containing protein [Croceicoccus bisphenolivorans]|uniref:DUF1428 domain-containing protein n=1 Tax=Croceicoccus bisphenolivorans TaxID=1783232 RepID=UPI000836E375|nr:DUF1428 domain-containing protein [Croceicoccus bisphenolivorans]
MYVQGFVIPVPEGAKADYLAMAETVNAWFVEQGATEVVECWETDVPDGNLTDFRRAVQAEAGEKIVFSWMIWPDKATCDATHEKMMGEDSPFKDMGETMPFDGRRMIYGGFAPIFTLGR